MCHYDLTHRWLNDWAICRNCLGTWNKQAITSFVQLLTWWLPSSLSLCWKLSSTKSCLIQSLCILIPEWSKTKRWHHYHPLAMSDTPIWSFCIPLKPKRRTPSLFVRSTCIYNSKTTRITLPLDSWSIPAFKVLGRWTTAHQQFSTCLPVTNRSSVFAESAPFPFSLCTRADAMHSVVFVDILFENLSCVVLLPSTDHG
jgi:hypothetical protein